MSTEDLHRRARELRTLLSRTLSDLGEVEEEIARRSLTVAIPDGRYSMPMCCELLGLDRGVMGHFVCAGKRSKPTLIALSLDEVGMPHQGEGQRYFLLSELRHWIMTEGPREWRDDLPIVAPRRRAA